MPRPLLLYWAERQLLHTPYIFAHINLSYDAHTEAYSTGGTVSGRAGHHKVSALHVDDVPSLCLSLCLTLSICLSHSTANSLFK